MEIRTNPKLLVPMYWKVWLSLVAALILVRVTLLAGTGVENYTFILFLAYAVPTWVSIIVLNFVEGHRLMEYLGEMHNAIWQELTSGPGFGPGGANSLRSLRFIYSKDYLGDEVLKTLKFNYRKFIWLVITVFITMPVLFIIVMIQ